MSSSLRFSKEMTSSFSFWCSSFSEAGKESEVTRRANNKLLTVLHKEDSGIQKVKKCWALATIWHIFTSEFTNFLQIFRFPDQRCLLLNILSNCCHALIWPQYMACKISLFFTSENLTFKRFQFKNKIESAFCIRKN